MVQWQQQDKQGDDEEKKDFDQNRLNSFYLAQEEHLSALTHDFNEKFL